MAKWGISSFVQDDNEKNSASRILACLAFVLVLVYIGSQIVRGEAIEWDGITAFLTATVLPYLGNSVKNGLRFFGRGNDGEEARTASTGTGA